METPKTYYGYDNEGNCLAQGTAQDASNYLDPEQVRIAINKVKTTLEEQLNNVAMSLERISEDSTQAIIVEGTSMSGTIEDTATVIKQLPEQVLNGIDQLYDYAVQARNNIQSQLNEQMRNQVASYSGVVRVS